MLHHSDQLKKEEWHIAKKSEYALAALACIPGLGSRRLTALLAKESDATKLWEMHAAEFASFGEFPSNVAESFRKLKAASPNLPHALEEKVVRAGAHLLTIQNSTYPKILKEIFDPPVVLYYRGTLVPDAVRIAMVGARKMSGYGEALALDFGKKLAAAGLTVVSGGAYGIDSASHKGALKTGRTVAVLGSGIDVAYPSINRRLFEEILAKGGAVLSEYGPGTRPLPAFFPARNRIISGLSKGTLVVEAARHSGSLITADLAIRENREVYAIPGSVLSAMCAGTNHLIQQGAKLVTDAADILEDYGIELVPEMRAKPKMDAKERQIYQVLSFDHAISMDEIMMSLPDGEIPNLAVTLLKMEMAGLVVQNASRGYRRAERE